MVREVHEGRVREFGWQPRDFGLAPSSLDELKVDGPEESAAAVRAILEGTEGPRTRIVVANAAAALLAAERVGTLAEGVSCAAEALASGRARSVLETLVTCSHAADAS